MRSRSKSNYRRSRSKSKPSQNGEELTKSTYPSDLNRGNESLANDDLETMLLAKTKILTEILNERVDKTHDELQREKDVSKETRKKICLTDYKQRKSMPSTDDISNKLNEQQCRSGKEEKNG